MDWCRHDKIRTMDTQSSFQNIVLWLIVLFLNIHIWTFSLDWLSWCDGDGLMFSKNLKYSYLHCILLVCGNLASLTVFGGLLEALYKYFSQSGFSFSLLAISMNLQLNSSPLSWANCSCTENPLDLWSGLMEQYLIPIIGCLGLVGNLTTTTGLEMQGAEVNILPEPAHTGNLWFITHHLYSGGNTCWCAKYDLYLYLSILLEPTEEHRDVLGSILNHEHCHWEVSGGMSASAVQKAQATLLLLHPPLDLYTPRTVVRHCHQYSKVLWGGACLWRK